MAIKRWHKKRRYVRHVAGHKQVVSSHKQRYRKAKLFENYNVKSVKSAGRAGLIRAPSYLVKAAQKDVFMERQEEEKLSPVEHELQLKILKEPAIAGKLDEIKVIPTKKDRIDEMRGLVKYNDVLKQIESDIDHGKSTLAQIKKIEPDSFKQAKVKYVRENDPLKYARDYDPAKGPNIKQEIKNVSQGLTKLQALKIIMESKMPSIGAAAAAAEHEKSRNKTLKEIQDKAGKLWVSSLIKSAEDVDKSVGFSLAKDKGLLKTIRKESELKPMAVFERVDNRSQQEKQQDVKKLLSLLKSVNNRTVKRRQRRY